MAFRGRSPGAPGGAALLLHKPTVRCQQRKSTHARLTAGSKLYTYVGGCAGGCFGEKLPALARWSRTRPCRRGGFVLDDNHRDLGSLCRSLGQSPEKEWVRSKANQIQDKTARIEELQVQQRILLFFLFVRAERGEIEVRLASGATRRRSRFPCPLGRSSSGGPGGPRSRCRSGVRRSRGNIACRG